MLWTLSRRLAREEGRFLATLVDGWVRSFAEAFGREFRMPRKSYDLVVIGTNHGVSCGVTQAQEQVSRLRRATRIFEERDDYDVYFYA